MEKGNGKKKENYIKRLMNSYKEGDRKSFMVLMILNAMQCGRVGGRHLLRSPFIRNGERAFLSENPRIILWFGDFFVYLYPVNETRKDYESCQPHL